MAQLATIHRFTHGQQLSNGQINGFFATTIIGDRPHKFFSAYATEEEGQEVLIERLQMACGNEISHIQMLED